MTLANPIFLWSLLGLAVPVAIHMLSRKEGKVIRLGSIRHVQETSTQQFKGIKLNEILLLALRCAMIVVFSLMLSGLQCTGITSQKWVVVEQGVENNPSLKSVLDSLQKDGYEKHRLSNGFPLAGNDTTPEVNYWKLAEQLAEKNLTSAVVFASNRMENFEGKRIALPPNIKWISVPSEKIDFPLQAVRLSQDSLIVRTGSSSAKETSFTFHRTNSPPQSISVSDPDSIRIALVSDESYKYDRRILIAALKTVEVSFPIRMELMESNSSDFSPSESDWCIWLSDKKIPDAYPFKIVHMQVGNSNDLIIHSRGDQWNITRRLNEGVALEQNLALQLAQLIIPSAKLQDIARKNDKRMMPDSLAWSSTYSIKSAGFLASSADRFLMSCLLLLLLIERITAYKRNQ